MPFRIALSGLNAASSELKVTGNNIANSGTVGFKSSRAEFSDVFAVEFGGTADTATGNGVRVSTVAQQFGQGSIEFTQRALDLSISGAGFFVMQDSNGRSYSRAGAFHVDSDGTVVNSKNQRLQIFPTVGDSTSSATTSFNTGVLQDLQLATTDGPPNATGTVDVGLNLDASQTVPSTVPFNANDPSSYTHSTSIVTYDSLGSQHTASLYYVKSATLNQWDSYMFVDGNQINDGGGASPTTLVFSGDGSLLTPASGDVTYSPISSAVLATGANPLTFTLDYSNTTQFGNNFSVNNLSQDGYASGRLSGIDVDSEGIVFARFTNGESNALGKVALANFSNVQGLRQLGDTQWAETFDSGDVTLGEPGTGSLGLLQSGALEASNVDIAQSLVSLITAQRNFQANSQVISTADTVTQTIINI
ncbi:MAG: flagellar hook protein FlgE [Gammaproteobacteria bacterium]|nr:flagellar hook protein FlgE [Gammaproteobacteria bacterium]